MRPLEFQVGDKVFKNVPPIEGVWRFINGRGKLNPMYIGSYEIIKNLNLVACVLALLAKLGPIEVTKYLDYEEHRVQILD